MVDDDGHEITGLGDADERAFHCRLPPFAAEGATPDADGNTPARRAMLLVAAYGLLAWSAFSLRQGSWAQQLVTGALLIAVIGGIGRALILLVREAQSRDQGYEGSPDQSCSTQPSDVPWHV